MKTQKISLLVAAALAVTASIHAASPVLPAIAAGAGQNQPAQPPEGVANPPAKKAPPAKQPPKIYDAPHTFKAEPGPATTRRPQFVAPPDKSERIVLIGNGLAERDVYYHRIETELALRYPEHALFFRNMGHVGDTPGFRPHPDRKSVV
jgi:hypothetical protein